MADILTPDLCVIGGGAGGLSVAAGASQMGASVVLVEKAAMGGECLNTGCVPSKALIACAHAAHGARQAGRFGISFGKSARKAPVIDFQAVHNHVHGAIAAIAPNDSRARFEALGVTVLHGEARFTGPQQVEILGGGPIIRPRRFVIATGSRPALPPVPGLADSPYLTNETIFDLTECPPRLVVLGGGPIGIELAQAFCRLGSDVTVIERGAILDAVDPELADVLRLRLRAEGVTLRESALARAVEQRGDGILVTLEGGEEIAGSHLLVATGRRPSTHDLGLEAAGITYSGAGIAVDSRLRTSNAKIYAVGDVVDGPRFTHVAAHQAAIVLRHALFRLPSRWTKAPIPKVVYGDPELAQVGLDERAIKRKKSVTVLRWSFAETDRVQAEQGGAEQGGAAGHLAGFAKVLTSKSGRILGAAIVGPAAGELIQTWTLAISKGLKIGDIAGLVAPYPSYSEINKKVAGSFFAPMLFSDRTKKLVRFLARFG